MKKKILTILLAMTVSAAMLCACGGGSKASSAETKTETTEKAADTAADTAEDTAEAEAEDSEESSGEGTFTLLDVSEDMVDIGVYGKDEDGTELVFTMFTGPDNNKYVSLFGFDNNSESGDVICGQYEAQTETNEDGDEWTYFDVTDVYTGNHFELGVCERPETNEVVFFDKEGNVVEGEFLSSSDTINYMASAVNLLS